MIPNLGWYILIVWLTLPKDVCRGNLMIWFCPRTLGGHQRLQPLEYISGWWFGTWILCFHSVGHVIIPTDELIFFRGVGWNHQPDILLKSFDSWQLPKSSSGRCATLRKLSHQGNHLRRDINVWNQIWSPLVICYIAIENGSSTVDLPIPNGDNGDFPYYQRVNPKNISPQFVS